MSSDSSLSDSNNSPNTTTHMPPLQFKGEIMDFDLGVEIDHRKRYVHSSSSFTTSSTSFSPTPFITSSPYSSPPPPPAPTYTHTPHPHVDVDAHTDGD
ncbi:hypothetical protein BDW22DRAFT_1354506 [Trametopsis cervina]|nr:hypothetical protein BDW22DRAFT_1354506 [Trametopsis cervina]